MGAAAVVVGAVAGVSAADSTELSTVAGDCRLTNLCAIGTETGSGGIHRARNGIASATIRMIRHTLRRSEMFFARQRAKAPLAMHASASERTAGSTRCPRKLEDASRTGGMFMTSLPCAGRFCVQRFFGLNARVVCDRERRYRPYRLPVAQPIRHRSGQ